MKNHRHLTALVPVLLLVAAGCSSGNGNASDTTSAAAVTAGGDAATTAASGAATTGASASGEKITIVASVPPTDHGWLGQIAAKAQAAADTFPDVDFRLLEAADADSQASQIETVINEHPDALVVLPYDGAQLTPVAEKAMEAGIPVVNVDPVSYTHLTLPTICSV